MPSQIETTDAAASTSTQYTTAVGQTVGGTLGAAGDHDWYRVHLTAGQQYTFAMVGTGVTGTNVPDAFLQLRNSAGTVITSDDDGGPGLYSTITYTAATTGDYYIDAGAYGDLYSGHYEISSTTGARAYYDAGMAAGDLIRPGVSWSTPGTPATVTWGVRATVTGLTDAQGNPTTGYQLTAAQIDAVRLALSRWSDVANINFVQVNPGGTTDNATILASAYDSTTDGAGAFANYPGSTDPAAANGDIHLNLESVSTTSIPVGQYSFFAIMHELGHAIGLAHPGDYNASPTGQPQYGTDAQFINDTQQYSVMSYFDESYTNGTANGYNSYPDGLMLYDIYAIQMLYGANMTTRTGNTVYGFNSNAGAEFNFTTNTDPAFCIWDAGGNDTIDASGFSQTQWINLSAGTFSNIGGLVNNISIAYGATIENGYGGGGSDTIFGNAVNNRLYGNGGNDTLAGGAGNDTLSGGAGTNGINGGSGRDVALYSFSSTQASITHLANGSWQVSYGGVVDTLTNVEIARFTNGDKAIRLAPQSDFDASNVSDILWRNAGGAVVAWEMSNGRRASTTIVGNGSNAWNIAGVGDFNNDGTTDILWRNTGGTVATWKIGNGIYTGSTVVGGAGASWNVAGVGDFNDDGTSDILWRDASGTVAIWNMGNGAHTGSTVISTPGGTWGITGVGDFDGDGTSDILWRNANGTVVSWEMENGSRSGSAIVSGAGSDWRIEGIGDFNGDGTSDILWRDTNGTVATWELGNGVRTGSTIIADPGDSWSIAGVGDFNGDGTSDILWRHTNGTVAVWHINNGQMASVAVTSNPGGTWQVA